MFAMTSRFVGLLAVVTFATTASIGCAAATDNGSEDSSDDALTSRQLSGVAAVEIATVKNGTTPVSPAVVVGTPKKVKSLLSTVKKLHFWESQPRCLVPPETTRLTFLDSDTKKLAT